jgi:hypothetical protein
MGAAEVMTGGGDAAVAVLRGDGDGVLPLKKKRPANHTDDTNEKTSGSSV